MLGCDGCSGDCQDCRKRVDQMRDRIRVLADVIEKLKACYNWDRAEYQTNRELVREVEEALVSVRSYRREEK